MNTTFPLKLVVLAGLLFGACSATHALEPVDVLPLAFGEERHSSAVTDAAGDFAYFASWDQRRSRLVKIDLATFERVDVITMENRERVWTVDIDPAGEYLYLGTHRVPVSITQAGPPRVIKVDLATFERVGSIKLENDHVDFHSAVIDSAGDFAYFGGDDSGGPTRLVKIDLANFERIDAITMDNPGRFTTGIIDPDDAFAYFGTFTSPARVVKIDLTNFEAAGDIELTGSGENDLTTSVMDSSGDFAYFGNSTYPAGKVIKIDLQDFQRVGAIQLPNGERGFRTSMIDPADGFAYFAASSTAGPVVKIDLSTFTRVGSLPLEDGLGDGITGTGVMAPDGGHAYFSTYSDPINFGRAAIIRKVDLATFEQVDRLAQAADERDLQSAVVDPDGRYAYFGTGSDPGRVVRLDLETFERVDAGQMEIGELLLQSAVIDPAGEFAYFGTGRRPGKVIKFDLANMERVDAISLDANEGRLMSAVIDPGGNFAYFGTSWYGVAGRIVKIDLTNFTRVGAITLPGAEEQLESAVIDPDGDFAYFGAGRANDPGRVVRIDLTDFTRDGAVVLTSSERRPEAAAIDPAGEFAYFGTETNPGRLVKIDLAEFQRVDSLSLEDGIGANSMVIDPQGRFAFFGARESNVARVVKIDLATLEPVETIQFDELDDWHEPVAGWPVSSIIDPDGDYAYVGTSNRPGWVVKVAINRELTFSPASLAFEGIETGTGSEPRTATLFNTGTLSLNTPAFSLAASGFAVDTTQCTVALAPGGSCDIQVNYTAFNDNPSAGWLIATEDADGSTARLRLTGNYDGLFSDGFEQ